MTTTAAISTTEYRNPNLATFTVGSIVITAPIEVFRIAGFTVYSDGTAVDDTTKGYLARRILRVMSELDVRGSVSGVIAIALITRITALGEIEAEFSRRDAARREVAKLEADTAAALLRAAELRLEAAKLEHRR